MALGIVDHKLVELTAASLLVWCRNNLTHETFPTGSKTRLDCFESRIVEVQLLLLSCLGENASVLRVWLACLLFALDPFHCGFPVISVALLDKVAVFILSVSKTRSLSCRSLRRVWGVVPLAISPKWPLVSRVAYWRTWIDWAYTYVALLALVLRNWMSFQCQTHALGQRGRCISWSRNFLGSLRMTPLQEVRIVWASHRVESWGVLVRHTFLHLALVWVRRLLCWVDWTWGWLFKLVRLLFRVLGVARSKYTCGLVRWHLLDLLLFGLQNLVRCRQWSCIFCSIACWALVMSWALDPCWNSLTNLLRIGVCHGVILHGLACLIGIDLLDLKLLRKWRCLLGTWARQLIF